MIIDIKHFLGEVPKVDPLLLADGYATEAKNCCIESGKVESIKGVSTIQAAQAGTKTIYKMLSSFLEWSDEVDVVKSLVVDSNNRVFFTGDGYPKDTNSTLALSGDGPYPDTSRRLGIPSPTNALTVTLNGTAGDDIEHSSSYVYTIVGKWEDGSEVESGPSEPTAVFDVYDGITPRLTGFVDATATGVFTTHFRIYRLNAGNSGAEYQYVSEIQVTESPLQYDDLVTDDDLQEILPSEIWAAPSDELSGITATSHGLAFGFVDNEIFPSEVFIPYSFPINYSMPVESDIIGLGYTGSMVIVLTETVPYMLIGSTPETLELTRLGYQQPCLSSRSIVNIPGGVVYASPDGLYMINESGVGANLTENIFKKTQWTALDLDNMIGVYYDYCYFAFFEGSNTGFKLNLSDGVYQTLSLTNDIHAAHYCPDDDTLYLVLTDGAGREIVSWETGDSTDFSWKSKEFPVDSKWVTAGMVDSDFSLGDITFNLYVDGGLAFTKAVSDNDIFMIPISTGRSFQVQVSGQSTVDRIIVAETYEDIAMVLNG